MTIHFSSARDTDIDNTLREFKHQRELLKGTRTFLQDSYLALIELPQRIAKLRAEITELDPSNQDEITRKTESIALIESSLAETPANIKKFQNDITSLEEMMIRANSIESTPGRKLLTMTIEADASKAFLKSYKENLQTLLDNSRNRSQRTFLTKVIAKVDSALNLKTMGEISDVTLIISAKEMKFLPSSLIRDSLLSARHSDILVKVSAEPPPISRSRSKRGSFTPTYTNVVTNDPVIQTSNASIVNIIKTRLNAIQNSLSRRDRDLWIEILSKNPRTTLPEQLRDIESKSKLGRLIGLNAVYEQVLIQNKQTPNQPINIKEAATQLSQSLVNTPDIQHKFKSSISKHTSGRSPISKIKGSQFRQMMNTIERLQKRNRLPLETFHGFDERPSRARSRHRR